MTNRYMRLRPISSDEEEARIQAGTAKDDDSPDLAEDELSKPLRQPLSEFAETTDREIARHGAGRRS